MTMTLTFFKTTRQQVCVSVSESLINKIDCHIETIVLTNMHKQYYLCIVNERMNK